MDMIQLEKMILAGTDDQKVGMKYAQGFGRSLAIIWGLVRQMKPEERDEFIAYLGRHSERWLKEAQPLEEVAVTQ